MLRCGRTHPVYRSGDRISEKSRWVCSRESESWHSDRARHGSRYSSPTNIVIILDNGCSVEGHTARAEVEKLTSERPPANVVDCPQALIAIILVGRIGVESDQLLSKMAVWYNGITKVS